MAKQYLTPPATYAPPDDKKPGEKFSATVELEPEEDGRLCILSIDGVPIEETQGDDEGTEASPDNEMGEGEMPMKKMGSKTPTLQEAVKAQRSGGYMM